MFFDPSLYGYPGTSQDAGEWGVFWRNILKLEKSPSWLSQYIWQFRMGLPERFSSLADLVGVLVELRGQGARDVLCAGNGIRIFPEIAAHLGYQAIGVDFSSVATEYVRSHPAGEDELLTHFEFVRRRKGDPDHVVEVHDSSPEQARATAKALHREGGTASYMCADLLDPVFEEGGFDVIFLQRNITCFGKQDQPRLLSSCRRWLRPTGVLVIDSTDVFTLEGYDLHALWKELVRAGFFVHARDADEWWEENSTGDGIDWVLDEYWRRWWEAHWRDLERCRSGEPMAMSMTAHAMLVRTDPPERSL